MPFAVRGQQSGVNLSNYLFDSRPEAPDRHCQVGEGGPVTAGSPNLIWARNDG